MSKKTKVVIVLAALVVIIGGFLGVKTYMNSKDSGPKFTIEVISERDNFSKTIEDSFEGTVGDYLRTTDFVGYEDGDYGMYIHSFYDLKDDTEQQYWWGFEVNGASSEEGVDSVNITDGDTYTFKLNQGW